LAKENYIGKRLIEAFGTDDKAFIAEKLGFSSVQAVYKVINGERELDFEKLQNFRNYTKRSIDWLLTGTDPAARYGGRV
jgi:transcriptional regulator with XRE-family HTH domain